MLTRVLSLLMIAAAAAQAQTSQPAWQTSADGQLILRPFANAPYPHKSREDGFKTFPKEPHYTDSTVAVFIPSTYKPGTIVNYIVHFHGHKNHVAKVLTQYKLPEQLAASKVNAILIVPQGPKDAADSGGGKLEDAGGFSRLISEITRYLRSEKKITATAVGQIVLSAHSGGYKVTGRILYHGGLGREIADVLLLDATYGELSPFANFCRINTSSRLVSLYTDHLADENKTLMEMLAGMKVKYVELDEAKLKDEELSPRTPIFIHTKGPHDQVPVDYFGRLLQTGPLTK